MSAVTVSLVVLPSRKERDCSAWSFDGQITAVDVIENLTHYCCSPAYVKMVLFSLNEERT